MMFNEGDRVRYTGKYEVYSNPAFVGCTGTVKKVNLHTADIEWDHKATVSNAYKDNLEVIDDRQPEPPEAIIIVNGNKGPVSYDVPNNDLDAMKNAFDELGLEYIVYRRES